MRDRGSMSSPKLLADAPAELLDPDEELSASAHEETARLAYSYWEARGGGGSPWQDWFRAEEELKRRKD
jgi:hypothetical protein